MKDAFFSAIKREPSGRYVVTTQDFVRHLKQVNWHFSLREANHWIKAHTCTFRDVSTQEGESTAYAQFSPNGGI
nr:DNA polymerase V [Pantoea sp.]